jgi:hypothetical protein
MEKKVLFSLFIIGALLFFPFGSHAENPGYAEIVTLEFSYGKGPEQIGADVGTEGSSVGPLSFTVDGEGNIYICDTVNRRIQIYSPSGAHLRTIALKKGTWGGDIVVDGKGNVYVYGLHTGLDQYDSSGNFVSRVSVDSGRWQARGRMHIAGDKIYMTVDGTRNLEIADISGGLLKGPLSRETNRTAERGIYGREQKYVISLQRRRSATIKVIEPGPVESTILLSKKGILLVQFVGEDEKENLYLMTESSRTRKLEVDVVKLSKSGEVLNTLSIQEFGSTLSGIRTYYVDSKGTVYQFLRRSSGAKINIYGVN